MVVCKWEEDIKKEEKSSLHTHHSSQSNNSSQAKQNLFRTSLTKQDYLLHI